jgi:DNA-directed RNA polymerase specialized sigma24 family protein
MAPPIPPRSEAPSLAEALERVGPKLRRILFRYRIPARDADDLLQETFLVLVSKQESVRNPDAWLQTTLSNRCVLYWRGRRGRVSELVDRTIRELLGDPGIPEDEAAAIRSDLDLLISRLPERCQPLLRRRYGLLRFPEGPEGEGSGESQEDVTAEDDPEKMRRCLAALAQRALGAGLLEIPPS